MSQKIWLDTHLTNSAVCKIFPDDTPLTTADQPPPEENSQFLEPQPVLPESQPDASQCSSFGTAISSEPKERLRLPTSEEEWSVANALFSKELVPEVLKQTSPDNKHAILTESLYGYYAGVFVTKQQKKTRKRQKKTMHLEREAREAKSAARREHYTTLRMPR